MGTTNLGLGGGPPTEGPGKDLLCHEETNDGGIDEEDGASNY